MDYKRPEYKALSKVIHIKNHLYINDFFYFNIVFMLKKAKLRYFNK